MKLRPGRRPRGAQAGDGQMTLMDHLRELRNRLIKMVGAIVVGGIIAYFFYDQIFRFLTRPYCEAVKDAGTKSCKLFIPDLLSSGFLLRIKVAGYGGVLLAFPVIVWQLWRFVMPGLYKNERKYTVTFVVSSVSLFAAGALMAYYTLPAMLSWLADNSGPAAYTEFILNPADYFWLIAAMMIGFGIGFEFPLVLIALQVVGILDNSTLRTYRRQAIVGVVAAVAVITPGGDPISLIALSIPMIVFYELAIVFGRLLNRKRAKSGEIDNSDTDSLTSTEP